MVSDAKIAAQALASLQALDPQTVTPTSAEPSPAKSTDGLADARSALQPIVVVRTQSQSPKSAADRCLTSSGPRDGADPAAASADVLSADGRKAVETDADALKERRDAALVASQRLLLRASASSTNPSIRAPPVIEPSAANENVVAPFLTSLYAIVDEEETNHIICWHESGTSFFVHDRNLLAREVLGKYFKHSNFSSFHRQANMYGFKSSSAGVGSSLQFAHPLFLRSRKDLLCRISSRRNSTGSRKRRLAQATLGAHAPSAAESTSPEQTPAAAAAAAAPSSSAPVLPAQLAAHVEPTDAVECGKLDMSKRPAAPFVDKTFHLVSDPATDDIICWTVEGHSFIVRDLKRFSYELLPRHFKHNNFSSFVRQAHYYSFFKLGGANHWEFGHKHFVRGRADLLVNIKRSKRPSRKDEDQHEHDEHDVRSAKRMRMYDDEATSPSYAPPRAADIPGLVARVLATPFGKSPDAGVLVSELVRAEERRRDALALLDAARRSYDAAEAPVLDLLERLLPDAPQPKAEPTTPTPSAHDATTPTSSSSSPSPSTNTA